MTLVSIIIPSYRQPHFLARAIESCLSQDHDDLEILVVDDHSRDASLGLALSYAARDERVHVVEAPENGGLGRARNIGLAHASGDYVCFLDSDDYLLSGSVSSRLAAIPDSVAVHGERLAGVYGDWQHVGEFVDYPVVRAPRTAMPLVSSETYTGENVFICSAPLVKRERVIAAGGFPEGLPMLEDFAMWARMIATGSVFAPVSHVVATYRQRPNSMLRGDGVVVMADYVEVINAWMSQEGVRLADGGALDAWLGDAAPQPFGRMSWNLPSPPGYSSDESEYSERFTGPIERTQSPQIPNFMAAPNNDGLHQPPPLFSDDDPVDVALMVHTLDQSLAAVVRIEELAKEGRTARAYVDDTSDWMATWPLALAQTRVRDVSELSPNVERIDMADHAASRLGDTSGIVARLCPTRGERKGGLVYVSESMRDYAALDAWISVALIALTEANLDPHICVDPAMRNELGGWRSEFLSLDRIQRCELIITNPGETAALAARLAPTVVFDPMSPATAALRTSDELRNEVARQLG